MLVSACLIVRDEANCLDTCLSHLKGFADEIIVVDTGSIDNTIEIAAAHGARLFSFAWQNDFASARNHALEQARGEWILYIDADERLLPAPGARQELDQADLIAATVTFRPAQHMTTYPEHRLFRNRPDIRFRGEIHETIVPDLHRIQAAEGLTIRPIDCAIEHDGYEGDLQHKHRRNLPLLLAACQQDPQRIYLWHALGECQQALGDLVAAEAAFRNGLSLVRDSASHSSGALIYADLMALHCQRPLEDIETLCTEAEFFESDPLVTWRLACIAMQEGDLQNARRNADRLADLAEETPTAEGALAWDRRLFGEYQWSLEANLALLAGEHTRAAALFKRCLEADPGNPEYRAKFALAGARAR